MRKNVIRGSVFLLVCFIVVAGVFAQGQSDTDSLYSKAYALFQSGKYDESIKVFSDFLDLNPKSPLYPSALFWRSESYHLMNDIVRAYKGFMRLIAEFPSSDKVDLAVRKLESLSAEDSGARLTRLLDFAEARDAQRNADDEKAQIDTERDFERAEHIVGVLRMHYGMTPFARTPLYAKSAPKLIAITLPSLQLTTTAVAVAPVATVPVETVPQAKSADDIAVGKTLDRIKELLDAKEKLLALLAEKLTNYLKEVAK